jgi:hypothetical protein
MIHTTHTCDIEGEHEGTIFTHKIPVMFDHDQEDGKSKVTPYFEMENLDICQKHFKEITEKRKLTYAYGAMGYNTYSL